MLGGEGSFTPGGDAVIAADLHRLRLEDNLAVTCFTAGVDRLWITSGKAVQHAVRED
jgi:hypothetical protein